MTTFQAAAFVALFALGANFLGTALLLLVRGNSREVRWYVAFSASIILWLAAQGTSLLLAQQPFDSRLFAIAVHMMPTLFLSAVLAQSETRRGRYSLPWAVLLLGLVLLAASDWLGAAGRDAWQVFGWTAAAAVYLWRSLRGRGRRLGKRDTPRGEKVLEATLLAFVPVAVAAAIIVEGAFVLFVLPLLTVVVQLLLFLGIVYHRYYDIEVRVARAGVLLTSAAERDRLALLGEMAATIAHEVRNPLTGIRSLTQLMGESPPDNGRRERYTAVIMREIDRLDRIVTNLTDLARRTAGNGDSVEPLDLKMLTDDLLLLVRPRATAAGVALRVDAGQHTVAAPRDAVAQVLLNLLINAIQHSPRGSSIDLCTTRYNSVVTVSVRDHGPGIPVAEREHIFQPFHSTAGTGLGLAVVRRLSAQYGWSVAVSEAAGGGAEFTLMLPEGSAVSDENSDR